MSLLRTALEGVYEGRASDSRADLSAGEFGAIAPYWCTRFGPDTKYHPPVFTGCGPVWSEPDVVHHDGRRGHPDNWEPDYDEWYCPLCGSEDFGENDKPNYGFKLKGRRAIKLRRKA